MVIACTYPKSTQTFGVDRKTAACSFLCHHITSKSAVGMGDSTGRICFSQLPAVPGESLPGIQKLDEIDLKTMMEKMRKDAIFVDFGGEQDDLVFSTFWSHNMVPSGTFEYM
jgi:hypothetical protein